MHDRSGLLPELTKTLYSITQLKLLAQQIGVCQLDKQVMVGGELRLSYQANLYESNPV